MADLRFEDCVTGMFEMQARSVDMVFADLPYGTTYAKWDSVLDMGEFWRGIDHVAKDDCACVFTAVQPFTTALISSNPGWFRVAWVWDKVNGANFGNAKRHPMKTHEDVIVFGRKATRYFPQKVAGKANHTQGSRLRARTAETLLIDPSRAPDDNSGMKYPKTIQQFAKHSSQMGLHPTQKPVDMVSYFLRTYSQEGDTILDPTMGSGTTGVAAALERRNFVGFENNREYFEVAKNRILEAECEVLV